MAQFDPYIAVAGGVSCLCHAVLFARRGAQAVVDSMVGGLALIFIGGTTWALVDSHQQGVTLAVVFGWAVMAFVMLGILWILSGLAGVLVGFVLRIGARLVRGAGAA